MRRIAYCFRLRRYRPYRPFPGFDDISAIPYGEKTAVERQMDARAGNRFFRQEEKLGRLNIIAEDLGFLTDSVQLLEDTGFPNKVIQSAFDSQRIMNYRCTHIPQTAWYILTYDNDNTGLVSLWIWRRCDLQKNICTRYVDEDELAWDLMPWP